MELHHTALRDGRLSDILKNEMHVSTGLMNRLKTTDRILVDGVPRKGRRHCDTAAGRGGS